ncbi:nck-associated protein 5-like isoform X4 [Heterodontus francisci]|uniref:nck-associated protein 5-like isoform X4 n=1 Tax=Heterodontus francisci TaxID=7792 RepID=UPI00355AE94E
MLLFIYVKKKADQFLCSFCKKSLVPVSEGTVLTLSQNPYKKAISLMFLTEEPEFRLKLREAVCRMEETVRNLLQHQEALGQSAGGTADLLKACQGKLSEEVAACKDSRANINATTDKCSSSASSIEEQEKTIYLLERLRALEAENSALALENEHQREQYERCLDEVANQVVQALLTQKDLREECLKLRTRVFDLEQQNRALSVLFQQRVRLASDSLLQTLWTGISWSLGGGTGSKIGNWGTGRLPDILQPPSDLARGKKLHSRIVDLSSGDLFSNTERNRSPIQSRATDTQIHETLQNTSSNVPILKCQSQLNLVVPSQLYPRSSCSSSEISLSSACSEHSSGSFTWNEGKTCSKRSSLSWEKRLSIGSSLPSNLSSPAEELPPTREKESHILEGLKKLQKKKPLFEPASIVSKWAYKDCMNSNEGIYSLGLKCQNYKSKDQIPFKATNKDMCLEKSKAFGYDSDSHDDADDDCTAIITTVNEVPSKDCKSFCKKLAHSVSDSLFGWDGNVKCVSERLTHTSSREKPEKLTSFVSSFQSSEKLCTSNKLPAKKLQFNSTKLHYKDLAIQLSDTEDIEMLDELHLECEEERNSSDFVTSLLIDKRSVSHANLLSCKKAFFSSADKDEGHFSSCSDNRPKTLNLLKENCQATNAVKTSSEECLTIVFDAEDGQSIKFNSQQTASVIVSSNEISSAIASDGNHQQTVCAIEDAALVPQGLTSCQRGSDARNYTVLESLQGHTEQKPLEDPEVNKKIFSSIARTDSVNSERQLTPHIPQQQKILKPTFNAAYKSNCVSSLQTNSTQKPHLTKIPNRGKSSPQKTSKVNSSDVSNTFSISGSLIQDKPPSLSNVKHSKYLKMPSISISHCLKNGSTIPKCSPQLPRDSKITFHNEVGKSHASIVQGSLLSRRQMTDHGEHPTHDKHDNLEPEEIKSPSPPPPPGRSTSLLFRPTYDHSLNKAAKTETHIPIDTCKDVPVCSNLKQQGITSSVSSCVQFTKEVQSQQSQKSPAVADLCRSHQEKTVIQNSVQQSQETNGVAKDLTMGSFEKRYLKTNCSNISPAMHIQPCSQTTVRTIRSLTCIHANEKDPSPKNTFSAKTGQLCENGLMLQYKESNILASSQCQAPSINEPSSQPQSSCLSPSSSSDGHTIFCCSDEKKLKTRIPVGLKGFLKSPPVLRKSSTVPGKHEKDSINIYSKGNASQEKPRQADASKNTKPLEQTVSLVDFEKKGDLQDDLTVKIGFPADPLENKMTHDRSTEDGNDVDSTEIKIFKRSISANNKPNLKPALGMNGAKARSQSFSKQTGEKPSVSVVDGPGKVRTQIITNTTERGNSLTRQNSTGATEAIQTKPACGSSATQSPSHSPKTVDFSYSRQVSYGSISSSSSHHSSPSKLPCRTPPKGDGHFISLKCDGNQSPPQKEIRSLPLSDKSSEKKAKQMPQKGKNIMQTGYESQSSPNMSSMENLSKWQSPSKLNMAKIVKKQENLSKMPEISDKVHISPSASGTQCSIEAKVMLGIQENMQKVLGQDKVQVSEMKQKTGPSIAKWFGFRKSKLPAPNGKKSDASKSKDEKKETKCGSSSGIKQTKLDKRKEKRKIEKDCEEENDVIKEDANCDKTLEGAFPSKSYEITQHEPHYSRKASPAPKHQDYKDHDVPVKDSTNDQFMQELLHRVDKKAAHQKENGSNHVSCSNMSKGNSLGSAFPSNSISVQANHGKNYKMKTATQIQNEIHKELLIDSEGEGDSNPHESYVELWQLNDPSPGKPSNWQGLNYENRGNQKIMSAPGKINVNPDNVKEAITESTCQDQMMGSSCQMRTLDSGIGTFPLPDSTNRATGRHVPKTTSCLECELSSTLQEAPHLTNVSQKANTLEREVPCRAECSSPGQDTIGHSASDLTVAAKAVQVFQSCLPKPSTAGFLMPEYKIKDGMNQSCVPAQYSSICKSEHSDLQERMKDLQQPTTSRVLSIQEQAMCLCSYSASSSDNETEAEFGTNENGTGGKELFNKMKNSKYGCQQHHIDKYPCFGSQSTVISFCQPHLYMQFEKEIQHFSVKQLHSDLSNDGKVDDIPSKINQMRKEESGSRLSSLPTVSVDTLNRINSNNLHIIEEDKNCSAMPEAEKEGVGKNEDPSLSSPEKTGVDNLESLSDSLYDSFSSCTSQASNEV